MNVRITDLNNKQVINVNDGTCIGFVNDVEVDTCSAKIVAIVVYGQPKFLGLFGRQEDMVIPWCDIKVIGEDTVLVNVCKKESGKHENRNFVEKLFED